MSRGGQRQGAGRKPGTVNVKTRAIADKAAAEGITPLEVMIHTMRQHFDAKRFDEASAVAKDAAPYIHARLSNIEQKISGDVTQRVVSGKPMDEDDWATTYGGDLVASAGAAKSTH